MTNPTPEGQQAPTEALIERLLELCRCGPDESCLYCETLPAAITTLTAENARLKSQTQDDCPEYAGSPVCKIHSYNEAHEIALGMGYPSITDAFEGQSAVIERLRDDLVNQPETADFMTGVPLEAVHQRERWGDSDEGKSPFDWFWLIGYLAQKAADAAIKGDLEKAKHHTISTAAALANWHCALSGVSNSMRPGIKAPTALKETGNAE